MVTFSSEAQGVFDEAGDTPLSSKIVNQRAEKLIDIASDTEEDGLERATTAYITEERFGDVNFTDVAVGEDDRVDFNIGDIVQLDVRQDINVTDTMAIHTHPDGYPVLSIQDLAMFTGNLDIFTGTMVVGYVPQDIHLLFDEGVDAGDDSDLTRTLAVHGMEWTSDSKPRSFRRSEIQNNIQDEIQKTIDRGGTDGVLREAYRIVLDVAPEIEPFSIEVGDERETVRRV